LVYRFDFNSPKALTKDEIQQVEGIVNNIIKESYRVSSRKVPLSVAKKVMGLRAVFGEVYPDPVRVLSIGPSVDELLSSPEDSRWKDYSIELCGGSHIHSTSEAEAFTIVEEIGISKGIRRIIAVTKDIAKSVLQQSNDILNQLNEEEKKLETYQKSLKNQYSKEILEKKRELHNIDNIKKDFQIFHEIDKKVIQLR
jgi:alanyl-tRNA synthetase